MNLIVAIDTTSEKAVSGIEAKTPDSPQSPVSELASRFECLFCGENVEYNSKSGDSPQSPFMHTNETCIDHANVSTGHQLGQQIVAKNVVNQLPFNYKSIDVDLERWIGSRSEFIIADVRVSEPVQFAVEVIYSSSGLNLHRRLQTLFHEGYSGMIVALTNGRVSPERIEEHLQKIGDIRVGRFDPYNLKLRFGSIVSSEQVNLGSPSWGRLPAYLA